ncbi:MAG TPA: phytanoyl-CoA dioxygenase family protein [Candidatus Binataceae bacterium]|nr:phytanoyl-CoA dioxygenase family protein [Candidatus Binataceae bacterium]
MKNAPEPHPLNQGFEWTPVRGPFRRISAEQARSFNERGFFLLEDAFDRVTIERVAAEIDPFEQQAEESLRTRPGKRMFIAEADGITFTIHLVKRSQLLREFAASEIFADLCHDLIGPDARLYWDQAVYKKPGYPRHFPWHQDNGYTYVEPQAYLTCWLALTDATLDNGCPWTIDGGHRKGTLKHRASEAGFVCRDEDGPDAVAAPVRAGGIVVFSSLTPHRTGPNLKNSVRKAYILQYAPDGARIVEANATCDAPDRQYLILRNGERVAPPPIETSLRDPGVSKNG